MEALLDSLVKLLLAVGPWIVLATTFLETALFVGLVIPAEAIVLLAAVLADAHKFSLEAVLTATIVGAFLGDQVGYLLGRNIGPRAIEHLGAGKLARLWRWYEPITARLFRRHAAVSVTLARFISFVRTLMPWFAGTERMPYGRFLFYDAVGVVGWSVASVAVGYAAGASWKVVAERIGAVSAYVIGTIILLSLLIEIRRRVRIRLMRSRVLRVALTGNIASGKSSVAEVWRGLGAQIIDADVLARKAVQPGTPGYQKIVREFGKGVIDQDGVNRKALRDIVFSDPEKRHRLEAIVHPEVARLREMEELKLASAGAPIVVNDIPLLFEVDMADAFDVVVLVDAPEALRVARIVASRGLPEAEARKMVKSQMPSEQKRARSTCIIENDGTSEELVQRATEVWHNIVQERVHETH